MLGNASEYENNYRIYNTLGQDVYYASENSDYDTRQSCGPDRPFEMNIVDHYGTEIIHIGEQLDT